MCIIFLWRQKEDELIGNYKFILAANRDEFFHRPAKPAHFWDENPNVLAGQDMTEDVEGGTWLGISRTGMLSALTNIRVNDKSMQVYQQGRGKIIADFLKSNRRDTCKYFEDLEIRPYRVFNLIAGDILGDLYYVNNIDENEKPRVIEKGYFCMTNSHIDNIWKKAEFGASLFKDALGSFKAEDYIEIDLYNVLRNTERNYPDPLLSENDKTAEAVSSVFVPEFESGYGTRTHTIITVDENDNVTFIESTKNHVSEDPSQWLRNQFDFKLKK